MNDVTPTSSPDKRHALVGEMLKDLGGAFSIDPVRIGYDLGLHEALHQPGAMTSTLRRVLIAAAILTLPAPSLAGTSDPTAGIELVRDSDFYQEGHFKPEKVELGRLLFFDKILSGNRNIACATCHHPTLGTSDALPLPLGEGAVGLGKARRGIAGRPLAGRVPRNSQAIYFLGAKEFTRMYHDGRVERDANGNWPSGFWTPAREQLPAGLDNVLAAQAMFPVQSAVEMAGQKGENEIADAAARNRLGGPDGVWDRLAARLRQMPDYVALFKAAFGDIGKADDITFVHAANALAAFEAATFRPDNSAFDRYLRTRDPSKLGPAAYRGMRLFYGEAGCSACHSGKFQTDHAFHAIAMPQIGPGKNDGFSQSYWQATGFTARLEDYGRYRVTARAEDKYRFRTPSLRNVALTGPWGHAGTYASLEDVVRHHADPVAGLERFDTKNVPLPPIASVVEAAGRGSTLMFTAVNPARLDGFRQRDGWVQRVPALRGAIARANELPARPLTHAQVADLVAFLKALTDTSVRDRRDLVPEHVPSGLPVDD